MMTSPATSSSDTYPFTIPGLSYPKVVEQIDNKTDSIDDNDETRNKQKTEGNKVIYYYSL